MEHRLARFRVVVHPDHAVKPWRATFGEMPTPTLVSVAWLASHLRDPHVRVLDGSWYLAALNRDPRRDFRERHIPGAQLFSIDDASDPASPLPHTLPPAAQFADVVSRLGISDGDHVVVYDGSGTNFSAPRVWWMFRAFGHDAVSLLDGGLGAWIAAGNPLDQGDAMPVALGDFRARLRPGMLRKASQVLDATGSGRVQVVDMRSRGRFEGSEPEPRPGLRGGHIPGSRNFPYAQLVDSRGLLRTPAELRTMLASAGIDPGKPLIASCGSGVTACSLLLALDVLGVTDTALYDGSWTEWAQRDELPVATGPVP